MASSGKGGNKWGSLLSQAVGGLEARLDAVLAEPDEASKQPKPASTSSTPQPAKQGPSRSGSSNRANDRLQERLARAVAAKNATPSLGLSPAATPGTASPRQSIDVASRPSVDSVTPTAKDGATDSARQSTDLSKRPSVDSQHKDDSVKDTNTKSTVTNGEETLTEESARSATPVVAITPADEDSAGTASPVDTSATTTAATAEPTSELDKVRAERIKTLEEELQQEQQQHQEEIHHYVEKMEGLESKLNYLAREASEAAKKAIQEAEPGSLEKKLAERDQQIAQLMEEGKNLGVTEQKHRAILKKLRTKITENEKDISELKATRSKYDAELQTLRLRAKRVTELERAQEESHRRMSQIQRELESLRSDSVSKDATIADLKLQVKAANEQAEAMKVKINDEALENERKRARDFEEQVATLQLEKTLAADRAKAQINEWKEKADRAAERMRVVEVEAKAEVQVMESKLEAVRVRAEEASSGATGDSQAKLLRQVETLQTQYAIASENWQGIESTLLARVASLEKERDEAHQRESEMRKKAREASLRAKRSEEDLEEARSKLPKVQEDVGVFQAQTETLRKRAEEAEAALKQARAEFESQKAAWKEERQQQQLNDGQQDRRAWLEDLPTHPPPPPPPPPPPVRSNSRPESPLVHQAPSRTWSSDFLGLQGLQGNKLRKTSTPSNPDDVAERFSLRRPSAQPPTRPTVFAGGASASLVAPPSVFSPTLTEGAASTTGRSMTHGLDHESSDPMDGMERPGSPQQVMQDMVSVSTVAAGPSVQLVERMSAAIRRLESEKVAAREELARISNQRNEARAEVLALIKDAEAGRTAATRVSELETEVADVKARYDTTLELLGEKSEMVEELRADVEDVKAMYRDLVERTIK